MFDKLSQIIRKESGISLTEGKIAMLSCRIARRLRALSLSDEAAYLDHLEATFDDELVHLLDAVSTNVTHFFREPAHFEFARETMGGWLAMGQRRFRFWSAASSSGEEPCSLAMTLADQAAKTGASLDIKILATDISTTVLARARAGSYEAEQLEGIPRPQRARYFQADPTSGPNAYTTKPAIRDLITYRRLNLSQPRFPMQGPMDMVFCRNVMIYFDNTVRRGLLQEIYRLLRPDGFLFIGHSENLTRFVDMFERVGPSVYQKICPGPA